MAFRHIMVDGLDYVAVPKGHVVYKAMGQKGMTTESMNAYLDSKGYPALTWFGELSNAKWYMKNWFNNKGQIYKYEFDRDATFLNMSKETVQQLLLRFKKNKAFVKNLKCFSGVGLSQVDQFNDCAQGIIETYPAKMSLAEMSGIKDVELKRYSVHDLDIQVAEFLCKNLRLDGYYSDAVRSDYGQLPIFPLEFATCFAKNVLKIVPDKKPVRTLKQTKPLRKSVRLKRKL